MEGEIERKHSLKLCVAGAAEADFCGVEAFDLAKKLGKEIVRQNGVLFCGATLGFPTWAAMGALEAKGQSIAFSPAKTEDEHVEEYELPTEYFNHIVYTGFGASGTNLILTRSSDAVFIGCGRIGTINEFTIAYEEHKPIGILKGPWKTDEIIQNIIEGSDLEMDNIVIDSNPTTLVEKVVAIVKKERARQMNLTFTD